MDISDNNASVLLSEPKMFEIRKYVQRNLPVTLQSGPFSHLTALPNMYDGSDNDSTTFSGPPFGENK